MSNDKWTKQKAAQTALDIVNIGASNLGGVTNSLHQIFRAFSEGSTDAGNKSAPMRLALYQAVYLATGQHIFEGVEFVRVMEECEKLAQEGS